MWVYWLCFVINAITTLFYLRWELKQGRNIRRHVIWMVPLFCILSVIGTIVTLVWIVQVIGESGYFDEPLIKAKKKEDDNN